MKLKSFGCSFVFGTDLGDEIAVPDRPAEPSQKTWPAILAQHLDLEHVCHARAGAGNLQILETVLKATLQAEENDLFVIVWSWIDRFDYVPASNQDTVWTNWQTVRPTNHDAVSRAYYQHLHSEYQDKLSTLIYVKTAIDMLKQKGIKFLMTYMDELMFDQHYHATSMIKHLQQCVKPNMINFEGMTFLDWSRQQGFEISPGLHPLEAAHRAAADYVIKLFDTQKTNDPIQLVHV